MTTAIIIFGSLVSLAGIIIIFDPGIIFGLLKKHIEKLELHMLAIIVRLLLGALLILSSSVSKFPVVIEIIGWISIVAAVFFAVIGRSNFKRIMTWALSVPKWASRVGGLFAVAFGGFLIYAFV